MIIYKREDGEFREVARVDPHGDVDGETSFAESLRDDLDEGLYIPGVSDGFEDLISEGPNLIEHLENRYSTGYYTAEIEEEDLEIMEEMSDDSFIFGEDDE